MTTQDREWFNQRLADACIRNSELEMELAAAREQRDKAEYDRTYAIGAIKSLLVELTEWEELAEFKNFHRLLCERFGYVHDPIDWKRDQLSLIEHIAASQSDGEVNEGT